MKILHIQLAAPYTEGLAYQENLLVKFHRKLGHDVTVLASCFVWQEGKLTEVGPEDRQGEYGIRLIRLPYRGGILRKVSRVLRVVPGVYDRITELKPDVIFLHCGVQELASYPVIRYRRDHPQVKLFVDNHADPSNSATNPLSRHVLHGLIWRRVAHKLLPYTERFFGVLPARVDFLHDVYGLPEHACELLLIGADDEEVIRASALEQIRTVRHQYDISPDDFLIVTGGKIDVWKTQTLLLMEAVKRITDSGSCGGIRVRLLVFGSVEKTLGERFDQLTDGNIVKFVGWKSPAETYDIIAASDLAVYPGRHSTLWEQTAGQGIPMICKYWDGTTHVNVCGNTSFLYQDSVEEIQSALEQLLTNREVYNEMKSAALRAADTFSMKRIAQMAIGG